MISVSKVLKHLEVHCKPLESVEKSINKVFGLVLAEDIKSPINMPPFKQSSMDGYAFIHSENTTFKIIEEVQAGSSKNIKLKSGEAVRIFTGARVPDDADTVVMQEHTNRKDNQITINTLPRIGVNVRALGEQIKVGDIALKKGIQLNEAAIGFLAGLGIAKVKTYKRPKIQILITGNELKQIGEKLKEGEVYDSNSITLKLALRRIGIKKIKVSKVKDDLKSTVKAIEKSLKKSDVVLISGGISVGDYDFVKEALERNEVKEVFYKVNQKPGKPLWFGHKKGTKVFALPGNPASSLSCFYVYVLPLLKAQMGFMNYQNEKLTAIASSDIKNNFGKTLFLKGTVEHDKATVLTGQASSMLKSFAVSNALLIVPEDVDIIKKGEPISYIKIR
ncbi:molybdopterin molybdotransferase MoeA [Winogradskyella ursingii]|uniref:molybdopterin molybdotransferase MoeA n=1 Tax=Winogradskyella ursingii TaxID=2686079 RepID=UPI0015CCE1B9|nr:gephyrin-like molybdotransferase Glp [Winogradskyella ursingii]